MGTETVPGTKVCPGGNEWGSKYPCKHQPDTGSFVHYPALQLSFSDRMHFPGTETADWCILLSFLVKAHAKTELLQEERGTVAPGMCGRGKVPQKNTGSCARHRNAYGIVLHCNGNPAEHFYLLYRKGKFRPAALPKNTFERKGIGSHCHELSAETFFPPFRSKSGITHNANNSEATEQVRNLLGFTGFLVVQTFNSQVNYK